MTMEQGLQETNNSKDALIPAAEPQKLHKESFNYASFDCGALIRASNKEAKQVTSILLNSKDAYMLNPCSAVKFVEIEICQDILVREVTLANFEFFSSQFKDFALYGSSKLPAEWKLLGNYTAKNIRDRQHFFIPDPVLWTKFIRIEFLSYYGNEFYCPLTSLQVFGTSMLEEMKDLESEYEQKEMPAATKDLSDTSTNSIPKVETIFSSIPSVTSMCVEPTLTSEPIIEETTTLASNKQDSIFAKIVQRLNHLEKVVVVLEQNYLQLYDFVNQTNKDQIEYVKMLQESLSQRIVEQLAHLESKIHGSIDEMELKKHGVDERLEKVAALLEELKVQLSWSQFWNHVMLFLGALSIKIVNDRVGLWGLWFTKPAEPSRDLVEDTAGSPSETPDSNVPMHQKGPFFWKNKKRKRGKKV
ncbi:hypothetical protein HDV03_002766 [Kappamyces sp. JEL0829]|nr:hypothetical protein HDV03_002766 [Kappamyces sp. JEL0829]